MNMLRIVLDPCYACEFQVLIFAFVFLCGAQFQHSISAIWIAGADPCSTNYSFYIWLIS